MELTRSPFPDGQSLYLSPAMSQFTYLCPPRLGTDTLAVRSSWGDGEVACSSRGPCGSSPRAIPGLGAPCPPVPLPDLTPQLGMVC